MKQSGKESGWMGVKELGRQVREGLDEIGQLQQQLSSASNCQPQLMQQRSILKKSSKAQNTYLDLFANWQFFLLLFLCKPCFSQLCKTILSN